MVPSNVYVVVIVSAPVCVAFVMLVILTNSYSPVNNLMTKMISSPPNRHP